MASKRQKNARKRFLSGGGIPTAPLKARKNPQKKNAPKPKKVKTKTTKTHPLRVPGMKPGDGCFMCKSNDHVAKFCPQKSASDSKKTCLHCRKRGHTLKFCPEFDQQEGSVKFCYNCGETGHRLAKCTQPLKDGGTSFAECFVCKQKGHISKNCPTNSHGIYPQGGGCKECGEVTHLAKDCPNKASNGPGKKTKLKISKDVAPAGKRIVFDSGDALEDDFEEVE